MCLIAIKSQGVAVDIGLLEGAFRNNPHGAGLAYRDCDKGVLVVRKGFMAFESLAQYVRENRDLLGQAEVIFHFRYATAGGVCPELCHPFAIEDCTALALETAAPVVFHNGHMSELVGLDDAVSDTAVLVMEYLTPLVGVLEEPAMHQLLGIAFPGSKFAIMTARQTYTIGAFIKSIAHEGWVFSNYGFISLWEKWDKWLDDTNDCDDWNDKDGVGEWDGWWESGRGTHDKGKYRRVGQDPKGRQRRPKWD
jgi:hypothetical protein